VADLSINHARLDDPRARYHRGWFLIVGPPAILEPSVRAVPHSLYDLIGWLYFTVFAYPGKWVLLHIWSGFFSVPDPASTWRVFVALSAWCFAFVFSYFFWLILFSRFWKLTGRWNPFGWKTHRMRPVFLRIYANVSDWWERETKFGRQATGGFASLLGILSNELKLGHVLKPPARQSSLQAVERTPVYLTCAALVDAERGPYLTQRQFMRVSETHHLAVPCR